MQMSNLTFSELERIAYAKGDTQVASLYAAADDQQRTGVNVAGAIGHLEEAQCYLIGEDFLVPLINQVRSMAESRVTKQQLLDLSNDMEEFQYLIANEVDVARDEIHKALLDLKF